MAGPPIRKSRLPATANRQSRTDLGLGATGHPPPKVNIVRVVGEVLAVRLRILPIRRTRDDQAVNRLHAPSAFHEFHSEPVEQGGVRRPLAVAAEVVDRRNDRPAEMAAPEMIDGHPGRQRVGPIGDPASQGQPAARAARRIGRPRYRCVVRAGRLTGGLSSADQGLEGIGVSLVDRGPLLRLGVPRA